MKKQKGGQGCGSCGCLLSPLSWKQMNQFGGTNQPVIIVPPAKGFQPILGIGQKGGCGTCNSIQVVPNQSGGGNFYKPIGGMPGPIVGSVWGPDKLPGANGIGGDRNYFSAYDTNKSAASYQIPSDANAGYLNKMSLVGGYRYNKSHSRSSSSYSKKGGGLVPQDLVNLGRDFSYNFKTAYNAVNGYAAPVNPSPYNDQLTGALNKGIIA
jgi:hypothetical protein